MRTGSARERLSIATRGIVCALTLLPLPTLLLTLGSLLLPTLGSINRVAG
jgi:hypothetical protein